METRRPRDVCHLPWLWLNYNHSSIRPNATYIRLYNELKIRFIAIKDINAGEEIFTNYNGDTDCRRPLWFEENTLTPAAALNAPRTQIS